MRIRMRRRMFPAARHHGNHIISRADQPVPGLVHIAQVAG